MMATRSLSNIEDPRVDIHPISFFHRLVNVLIPRSEGSRGLPVVDIVMYATSHDIGPITDPPG